MNLVEKNFVIEVKETKVMPFEEKVLTSGLCDFVLPMKFKKSKGMSKITYDCSGYSTISQIKLQGIKDILEILEKTLITYNKSNEFLINSEKIALTVDTVFYHLKYRDVKIAYIPSQEHRSFKENLEIFINQLKEYGDGQSRRILDKTYEEIQCRNLNAKEAINYIGSLRRELFASGIIGE